MKTECCACRYRDICKWKDAMEGIMREVKDDFAIKAKDRPELKEFLEILRISCSKYQLEPFPIFPVCGTTKPCNSDPFNW